MESRGCFIEAEPLAALDVSADALSNSAPVALLVIDSAGRCCSANPAAAALFRVRVEALLGQPIVEVAADRGRLLAALQSARGHQAVHVEGDVRCGDGTLRATRWSLAPLSGPAGASPLVVAAVFDIEEEDRGRRARELLAALGAAFGQLEQGLMEFLDLALERLLAALEPARGAIFLADEGRWTRSRGLPLEDVPQLADDITRGQGSGGSVSVPLAIGGEVLGALTVAPGRGRLGAGDLALLRAVASVLASAIFRHRAAERARRQAEADRARLAGVLAALPVAVYTVDTAGHVTGANPSATALAGEASAPLLGRPCREVFPLRDEAGRLLCDWACPRERFGQAPVGGVVRAFLPASDAGTRILHWSCAPVRAPDGHQLGWVEVVRDVSQLHEIEALRQTFLSAVSHELLSPVAIIKGHAETLRDPVTRSDRELAEAALQAIDEESERLRRLVLNVLDAARAASGAFTIERAPLALGPIIERVVRSFRGRSRRHQFATRLPGSLPLVLGDRDRLESVLYNLLDNAVKYSPRGGEVVVRAEVQTTEVEVIVEDEGVGIRRDELERIFQPYVRAIGDGQPNVPGSGLGLSIAKTIIEAHGGRIWMENRPVRGAACHFTVPRAGPAPLPVPRPSQAENAR